MRRGTRVAISNLITLSLDRARKRKKDAVVSSPASPIKSRRLSQPEKDKVCLFCDASATRQSSLNVALTDQIDERVRAGANLLRDTNILRKIDVMYHSICLTRFYNRVRKAVIRFGWWKK